MKNIKMRGTGVYIPKHKVYNQELDEHFEKMGLQAHGLMEHLGRRKRYFISEGENTITMCQEAIENCVSKNKLNLEDVEMVIVCTDTPEYLFPSNAMKIVGLYGERMKNVRVSFDLNSNCTGMIQGIDVVYKYMRTTDIKNALVVGCFCITPIALWTDTVVYATFADAAACVALYAEEEDVPKGFLDTETVIDASFHHYITYPKCGMSKVPLKAIEPNEKRLEWNPFNMDFVTKQWYKIITAVLERHNLAAEEIDYYIFSQLSDVFNIETLKLLGVSEDKYFFVGKEYGYTGNTCPVLCLNRMWDTYAKPGNKVIICTVGAGYSAIAELYEF
ncbi:MAG: hypothetical protein NC318_09840 [Blautia sp.]|nr:hypothetical protein [Lachnoclostridium sp.]MCM1211892.1 hypothetical protein [Blautia sp.]